MKKGYFSYLATVVCCIFFAGSVVAQSTEGPIEITEFADSTNMTAGDNFPEPMVRGETYTVVGEYGNIGAATQVRISYDIYAADWSGLEASHTWIITDDTTGVFDGSIDFDFTIPEDAALTDSFPGANSIMQVRVTYDPDVNTFWNIFVMVVDSAASDSMPPTAIQLPQVDGLELYPNPVVNKVLKVETPQNLHKSVTVYDLASKAVATKELMGNGTIDLHAVNPGYYLVKVKEADAQTIRKIQVK